MTRRLLGENIKLVWDNESSSYKIWISIGFTLKMPGERVRPIDCLDKGLNGARLFECSSYQESIP